MPVKKPAHAAGRGAGSTGARRTKTTSRTRPRKARRGPAVVESLAARRAPDDIPETFLLTTVEQVRCISVPVRLRVLQLLAQKPMTTKQVAIQLGEPITGLYRHVDALAAAGLIRLVSQVPKRGTVQKFFRAAATSFKVEDGCLSGSAGGDARQQAILEILNETRNGIARGIASPNDIPVLAGASLLELQSAEDAREVMDVISKAVQTWSRSRKKARGGTKTSTVTVSRLAFFLHPADSAAKPNSSNH